MDYIQPIQKTLAYIDNNIMEKITIEDLAHLSGFSKYHYCRLFRKLIGIPVMEYITIRKLQFSSLYLNAGERIIDIALRFNFETHAGYTKAFKRHYGYSPIYYRMHAPVGIPPKINLLNLRQNKLSGIILEPKILTFESKKIVGYKLDTTLKNNAHTKDVPAFWDACETKGMEAELYATQEAVKHGEYGICICTSPDSDVFSYVLGVEVVDFSNMVKDMYALEIPGATYAVFSTPPVITEDFATSIQGTWNYILEVWFPNSCYEVDDKKPDFEFYDERCHDWEYEKVQMDIYIPIKNRKNNK